MKIYNSLTKKKEEIKPIHKGKIGLYACGPTVYDYTHIGHLRKYIMDDVLVRALRHFGYKVKHVQNITDVGHLVSDADTGIDKLEKGSKKYNMSAKELAQKFEKYFFYSLDKVNCKRPDISCRATEHIKEQIDLVKKLEKKGYTYKIEGDGIYFDTSKFPKYKNLFFIDKENIKEGARIGVNLKKKNPTDFALWKFEKKGENRQMVWESPWGKRTYPGWHIECSAMSTKYLGEQFDIHTGGIDHIPLHHPNEIAQCEAGFGKEPFVKYWVHHNYLLVDGEKMSKSLGNFYTIDDILKRGFDPIAFRLLVLETHYRSEMNFKWDSLKGAQKSLFKLYRYICEHLDLKEKLKTVSLNDKSQVKEVYDKFFSFVYDDLHIPQALSVMFNMLKSDIDDIYKLKLLFEFDKVLGLKLSTLDKKSCENFEFLDVKSLPKSIQELLAKRQKAKQEKNFTLADKIRKELAQKGYELLDTKQGVKIRKIL